MSSYRENIEQKKDFLLKNTSTAMIMRCKQLCYLSPLYLHDLMSNQNTEFSLNKLFLNLCNHHYLASEVALYLGMAMLMETGG